MPQLLCGQSTPVTAACLSPLADVTWVPCSPPARLHCSSGRAATHLSATYLPPTCHPPATHLPPNGHPTATQRPPTCHPLLQEENAQLWRNLEWAKGNAPSHPHPEGPAGGIASRVVHPVVGVVDKVGRGGSRPGWSASDSPLRWFTTVSEA